MMRIETATRHVVALIVLMMMGTTQVAAQGWGGSGKSPAMSPPAPGMEPQRRLQRPQRGQARQRQISPRRAENLQRMQERVNTMRMWKLTEYLDLSEEQADTFFPRTREHQEEADKLTQRRRQLYDDFQKKIDEGEVKDKDVDQFLDEMARLEKAHVDLRIDHIRGFKDILTDEQLAKFAVFREHFRREVRQHIGDELVPPPPGGLLPEDE